MLHSRCLNKLLIYLLQLVEAVNLINKENGPPPKHDSLVSCQFDDLFDLADPTGGG